MGLFDLFGLGDTFDYDGDGKTGLFDTFAALEWFNMKKIKFILKNCSIKQAKTAFYF